MISFFSYLQEHNLNLSPALTRSLKIDYDVRTTTRDGMVLLGTHLYPRSMNINKPLPLVLIRSPYGRSGFYTFTYARPLAERGFQVFVQSCRGTTRSGFPEGTSSDKAAPFYPYKFEARDGVDTIRWIMKQTWYPGDGKVFLFGLSYLGFVQWSLLTAPDLPPGVIAGSGMLVGASNLNDGDLAPSWEILPGEDSENSEHPHRPYTPVFSLDTGTWWLRTLHAFEKGGFAFLSVIREGSKKPVPPQTKELFEQLPILTMDERGIGEVTPWFREMQTTPHNDVMYWDPAKRTPYVKEITIPMCMVSGWHDIFLPGLVSDFKILQVKYAGTPNHPRLLIGPWEHNSMEIMVYGTLEVTTRFLPLISGNADENTNPKSVAQVAAYASTGGERVLPVRLFVQGSNVWKEFATFPPKSYATPKKWYLRSGSAIDLVAPTEPIEVDKDVGFDTYVYDPRDPTPQVGGPKLYGAGPEDQRTLESRSDVLVYTSAPLTSEYETISDDIHLVLYASSSSKYTDFVARLCDVDLSGVSKNITDGVIRLDGSGEAEAVRCFRINLSPTAYCFKKGHRIRLQVCSAAFPRFSRSMNTAEHFSTATEMRAATQKVMRSGLTLSHIVIPTKDL
ncbi:galactose-binding domain-like protein [Cladochytrium replicatum]|nr:galactose-binding domain-like protein [Cladochytrium replicatum]